MALKPRPRVLVGCEYSGVVRDAFIARGWDALSCDLLPTERPGPHHQGDVLEILGDGWDLAIFHPPCTYLSSSGLHWNGRTPGRQEKTDQAIEFVRALLDAPIAHIALENPIGCISTRIRKASQIIQPYQYGEDASKATCLWLEGLPLLKPTKWVQGRMVCCGMVLDRYDIYGCHNCFGEKKAMERWGNQTNGGQNKLHPSKHRWKDRSRTYHGIAEAMADQWGMHIEQALWPGSQAVSRTRTFKFIQTELLLEMDGCTA